MVRDTQRLARMLSLRADGHTFKYIGEVFGVTRQRVKQMLLDEDFAVNYITGAEIARQVDCHPNAVRERAKRLGIYRWLGRYTPAQAELIKAVNHAPKDLTGQRIPGTRLTVVGPGPRVTGKSGRSYRTWICKCACGSAPKGPVFHGNLMNGATRSCGCLRLDNMRRLHKKRHKQKKLLFA